MGLNLTLTYLNYRGLHVVGNAAIVMTGLTLAPFVIITLLGGRCVFGTGGMMGEGPLGAIWVASMVNCGVAHCTAGGWKSFTLLVQRSTVCL